MSDSSTFFDEQKDFINIKTSSRDKTPNYQRDCETKNELNK